MLRPTWTHAFAIAGLAWFPNPGTAQAPARPNILWITCEDLSPHLGCFGDVDAHTPHLDRFAVEGVRYTNAFAPIGVCAPARSSLITGVYAPSLGTHHMRCQGVLPEGVRPFPAYLHDAGYFTSNRSKTDYNFAHGSDVWDRNGNKAHWRQRAAGQPFFSVINLTVSHEGQIRASEERFAKHVQDLTPGERHDPTTISIPPYHPDLPEVRRDWARLHDLATVMDAQVGAILAQLEEDGLADDTIVFFFADHGTGMPRSKRWLYDSSTRVPFIVRVPERFRDACPELPGTLTKRLVTFVDLAPTVLELAGLARPAYLQGSAFLGAERDRERRYVHFFRDRMDERYDMLRAVRDPRYRYIRNVFPDRPYAQHIEYMGQMPTMQAWERAAREGTLRGPERAFFADRKPAEELYDTWADPHEVHNLADDPEYDPIRKRMQGELVRWMRAIHDLGFFPEHVLRERFGERSPYDAVREDAALYPYELVRKLAFATGRSREDHDWFLNATTSQLELVRWWGLQKLIDLGLDREDRVPLHALLQDDSSVVRVAAARALLQAGDMAAATATLLELARHTSPWVRLPSVIALDDADLRTDDVRSALRVGLNDENGYVQRVARKALADLKE